MITYLQKDTNMLGQILVKSRYHYTPTLIFTEEESIASFKKGKYLIQ